MGAPCSLAVVLFIPIYDKAGTTTTELSYFGHQQFLELIFLMLLRIEDLQ